MTNAYIDRELDLVFGKDTTGSTPEARAQVSKSLFVRSQIQLAPFSEGATGRILTASQALRAFGWPTLRQAAIEGSAPLVVSPNEPAMTLRSRREEIGITKEQLAKRVKVSTAVIEQAEMPGFKIPIRMLESIAQTLAIDERVLGAIPNAGRDSRLGVRLREMQGIGDIAGFTANTVFQLAEAAWVIARQSSLDQTLEPKLKPNRVRLPKHDPSFGYPAYEIGYRLAEKTRVLLGLDEEAPIESVRKIIEEDFGLPLVQQQMIPRFAGATIANETTRGIVVNEAGSNSNVWVRRMTLCHELGHLLWDPEERLQRVAVDNYAELEMSDRDSRRDPPEIRANAFAVAFLAPRSAVRRIGKQSADPLHAVSKVMTTFGISASAARHHVKNITGLDAFGTRGELLPEPEAHWAAMENLTLDFFPLQSVPLARRGKFAWHVAKAFELGEISLDSAASYLAISTNEVTPKSMQRILDLA